MIRINKGPAPKVLVKARLRYDAINNKDYLDFQNEYDNGIKAFEFKASYRSKTVKKLLTKRQNGKCCFCEAKFVNDDSHVEHFRPKGRVDSWPDGKKSYPGYYWLAYAWDNLFLCKSTTNSSVKMNYFPLITPVTRNTSHLGTAIESPIIIDPSKENPRDFIVFQGHEIVGLNDRGKQNIELLGLRNPQLDEARRNLYMKLQCLKDAVDLLIFNGESPEDPRIKPLIDILKESIKESAEFSSMAIDLLQGWLQHQ